MERAERRKPTSSSRSWPSGEEGLDRRRLSRGARSDVTIDLPAQLGEAVLLDEEPQGIDGPPVLAVRGLGGRAPGAAVALVEEVGLPGAHDALDARARENALERDAAVPPSSPRAASRRRIEMKTASL